MDVLKIENLKKEYANGDKLLYALDNVSFTVKQGEFIAIVRTKSEVENLLYYTL